MMMGKDGGYYLFGRGHSSSVAGPSVSIGWDRAFILVRGDVYPEKWIIPPVEPQRDSVPPDGVRRQELLTRLLSSIKLKSAAEAWGQLQ